MNELCIPEKVLDQHLIDLGKTGSGKSSALRHIVEHLLHHKKRVCIVDPKGDWWGLKFSADGRTQPFQQVIAFGDFKDAKATDVPINAHSGKQVAELIASGNRPCVIGLRGWMPAALSRFWVDFASTLFNSNGNSGLYLVIDEVQNFAPKERLAGGDENLALHWTKRLMLEGRGLGIVMLMASQRPQNVHNTILTQCETLVAMRVIHEADRAATKTWIKGAGDKVKGAEVLNSLAAMARGEAWVWSPEINFGPQRVKFPMFETFDSFAPPAQQKKISLQDWSTVNLDEVKSRLAAVIEEQKANDPATLKAEVRKLKAELQRKDAACATPAPAEIREVSVFTAEDRALIEKASEQIRAHWDAVQGALGDFNTASQKLRDELNKLYSKSLTASPQRERGNSVSFETRSSRIAGPVPPIPPRAPAAPPRETEGAPTGGLKRMLVAIRQRQGLNKRQLGVRAGLSSTSGTFGTYLAKLRSNGWIYEQAGGFWLTDVGALNMGDFDPLPEGEALQQYWLRELGQSGAARMFECLLKAFPKAMSKEELGAAAGISHSSGTFGTYLARLRTLELAEGRGELRAAVEFFD